MDITQSYIDYKMEYGKENEITDPKVILNNLLKKMLDHKLNKLEKKHVEESNSLKIMSKISQNVIITLEHYSHKVRKEIYKLRHKNDEKKREHENNKKNIEKYVNKDSNNIDNNIESLINKDKDLKDNKLLFDALQNKLKKTSKSIDPKKNKSFYSEKSSKKDKMAVFERLSSKSIGNFKKLKLTINEAPNKSHLLTSKSKSKKTNTSSKNIHNILNKKNEGEKNSEHSPSNKGTPYNVERRSSKANTKQSTPKLKQKLLKKVAQINIENTNNNETLKVESSKGFYNTNKLKKSNSKRKITQRLSKVLKKEEIKNIENNNKIVEKKTSINNINAETKLNSDNKLPEIKIENTIYSKIDNNKREVLSNKDIKGSLFIEDEIIKNVNKDELLVSQLKEEEQIDEINEISAINFDDINLKDSINLNINIETNEDNEKNENKNIKKKLTADINNNSINNSNSNSNSINNNKSINNIKPITTENKNIQINNNNISKNNQSPNNSNISKNNQIQNNSNISKNNQTHNNNNINKPKSSNNINNILLNPKKNPVNFLENDEINFTLVEDSHLEENENDKTIDLNISGLSDQLSLEEKFETHLDEISRYLGIKDLCNLMLLNKECFTTIMNVLISKTEITIDILEEEINKLKETNKEIDFNKIKLAPFKFSSNSARAISLLNNSTECNLIKFNKGESINKEIFIVFGIFFIAAGKKKEYLRLNTEEETINYICNYFKNDIKQMSLGSLIEKEINGKIFNDSIISSLYKYSYKYINIISPNRFQKTNKDVAIFVFVVKNILEHIGALDRQNIKPDKEYILYNARLKDNKVILEQLNNFFDKIN